MEHPNPEQRKRVAREAKEDRRKTIQKLLTDVHDESVNAKPEHAPLTRTIARFASLLVVLFDETEDQTRRIISLTRGLLALTAALLVFTIVLAYIAHRTDQTVRQIHQIAEQEKTQQKTNPTAQQKP